MMTTRSNKLRSAIGSRWLIFTPTYAWLLPVWFSGSILSTRNLSGWQELLTVTGVNIFALGICSLEFLLFRVTLWRSSQPSLGRSTSVWLVLLGGVLLGATKALITAWGTALFLGISVADMWGRVLAGSVLGVIVVMVVPITLSELEHYRAQREKLINEIVRQEVEEPRSYSPINPLALQEFVSRSLETLAAVRQAPETLPEVLDHMRENEIRPLSHRIWKREQEQIPDFTLGNLISVSLTKTRYVVIPVILGYVVLMGPSQLTEYGLVAGAGAIALQIAIIALGLSLASLLPSGRRIWGISSFLGTNAVMTLTIALLTTAVFGPIPHYLPLQAALGAFQVLVTLTLFTSVYDLTRKTHKAVEEDLLKLSPDLGITELKRAQQSRENRELAQLLHSQVQNVFLAKSVHVKREMSSKTLNPGARQELLERNIADLETYIQSLIQGETSSASLKLSVRVTEVIQSWSPILDITVTTSSWQHLSNVESQTEVLLSILTEGISNAVRHGLANRVVISLDSSPAGTTLQIDDDGVGPREGTPGLGSYLFMSIPHSTWQLTRSTELGGASLRITLYAA